MAVAEPEAELAERLDEDDRVASVDVNGSEIIVDVATGVEDSERESLISALEAGGHQIDFERGRTLLRLTGWE